MTRRDELLFEALDRLVKASENMEKKLDVIAQLLGLPGPAVRVEIVEIINGQEVRKEGMESLKGGAKKLLKVNYKDAAGKPAKVDGAPKWQTDESFATLLPAEDGLSCKLEVKSDAPLGVFKVQVLADPDMTPEGVKELIGYKEYEVVSGEAVFVELTDEDILE